MEEERSGDSKLVMPAVGGSLAQHVVLTGILVIAGCILGSLSVKASPLYLLAVSGVFLGVLLIYVDRIYGVIMLTALSFVNPSLLPALYEFGEFTLRLNDVAFYFMVALTFARIGAKGKSLCMSKEVSRVFLSLLLFLGYIALTLFNVHLLHPDSLTRSVASFTRLAQYVSIAYVIFMIFERDRQIKRFLLFFALGAIVSVIIGAYHVAETDVPLEYLHEGGVLGKNSFGLVSGLLFVLGAVQYKERLFRWRAVCYIFLIFGFLGLFLSKSISSTLATVVTLAIYRLVFFKRDILTIVRLSWLVALAGTVFVLLLYSFRPDDIEGLMLGSGGSLVFRLVMAMAGIDIFKEHPIVGVGWQLSSLPEVIGDTNIGRSLRSLPFNVPEYYFPDVAATSVHNLYVQILAELGIIGMIVFLWMTFQIGQVVVKVIRAFPEGSPLKVYGRFFGLALIFLLTWWNTNPLYGGQIETFLFFTFLGVLLALPRISQRC